MPRAAVVIPTRNEEQSIARVIQEVRSGFVGTRYNEVDIVLADDSSDRTRRVARELGAIVVPGGGEGLGVAMYRGLKAAAQLAPDVIVAVDGDGQADAATEIKRFLAPIERDEANLVIGSRFSRSRPSYEVSVPLDQSLGTRVLSAFLRSRTGLPLTDSHGGSQSDAARKSPPISIFLARRLIVQESILDAVEKGYRVNRDRECLAQARAWNLRSRRLDPEIHFEHVADSVVLRSGSTLTPSVFRRLTFDGRRRVVLAIILAQEGLLNIGKSRTRLLLGALRS